MRNSKLAERLKAMTWFYSEWRSGLISGGGAHSSGMAHRYPVAETHRRDAQPDDTGRSSIRRRRLLFGFALVSIVAGAVPETASQAAVELPGQGVSFTMKDGMLTATFADTTDDAALNAAIPI